MLQLELGEECHLRLLEEADAKQLARVVGANRAYLAEWLPWAGAADVDSIREYVARSLRQRLNRIEIRVAIGNDRSTAIPERLGFTREGVLRQAERHGETYKDIVVYSVLAQDRRS